MSSYPHLSRAPITEALLDIRVELPKDTTAADLERGFGSKILAQFPDARPINRGQAEINLIEKSVTSSDIAEVGKIYWTSAQDRAVQATRTGFTFNYVRGYENFDTLVDAARPLWDLYCAAAQPLRVTRCALRFINRLTMAVGKDLAETLTTMPKLGEGISDSVSEYFMRIVTPFEEHRKGVITQALIPTSAANADGALVLDIDVFTEREVPPLGDQLWDELAALRELKNRCFFNSLTTDAVEAYR